jgi:hypothetical protein
MPALAAISASCWSSGSDGGNMCQEPCARAVDTAGNSDWSRESPGRSESRGFGGPLAKVGGEPPGPPLPRLLRLIRWLVHTSNMADGSTLREANQTEVLADDF